MARRRMIEVTIAYDKHLNSLSEFAQLTFLKILPHTDDFGRFDGDPIQIKARTMPLSARSNQDVFNAVCEIIKAGLVKVYLAEDKLVLQYGEDSFGRINAVLVKNNKGGSEYPNPSEFLTIEQYESHVKATCLTLTIKSKEYKVKSIKYKEGHVADKFDLFWKMYPRKTSKKKASESFNRLNPTDELFDGIMIAIENQKAAGMLDDGQFTPHASTWLNQERWSDQIIKRENKNGIQRSIGASPDELARLSTERAIRNKV